MAQELSQSEPSRPATGQPASRGGALDALRFVAALLIVLYHYGTEAPTALASLHPVFERGYLATDFFLILSGFVLGRAYGAQVLGGRVSLFGFLKKRVARIWPAQLVVLAAIAAVVAGVGLLGVSPENPQNFTPTAIAMQALLVQAWGVPGGGGWNHQSWSLSALLVCYAMFPLLWAGVSRLRGAVTPLAIGLITVVAGDLICMAAFGRHIYDLEFHLGVIRAAPLFLLGVCIARVVEQGRPPVAVAQAMAVLAVIAVVLLQIVGRFDLPSIVAIAAIVLSFGRLPVKRPSALIEEGAKLSFALFITHGLTGLMWFGALGVLEARVDLPAWAHWTLWAGAVPASLVVAALFHRLIDDPVQKWLAPRLKGVRKPPRETAAPAV
jgi:peptidoglycan/LPS O-acetylase OafA/YrhL